MLRLRSLRRPVRIASVGLAALVAADASSQLVIGGFDATRGGSLSIVNGGATQPLRDSISAAFPGTTFSGAALLTPAYLAGVDIVFLSSATGGNSAITPLSPAEQAALSAFVLAGGRAILATDNDTFAGGASDPANESLVDPFGIDCVGTGLPWSQIATVASPADSPVTSGPFGTVEFFQVGWSGSYDGVPPTAQALATVVELQRPGLLVIPFGALGPSSGAVMAFADSTMFAAGFFAGGSGNEKLLLNAIAYDQPSCPVDLDGSGAVDASDLAVLLGAWGTAGPADLDGSGQVDAPDLAVLLGAWGPCP